MGFPACPPQRLQLERESAGGGGLSEGHETDTTLRGIRGVNGPHLRAGQRAALGNAKDLHPGHARWAMVGVGGGAIWHGKAPAAGWKTRPPFHVETQALTGRPGALPRAGVCRAVGALGSWQASQVWGRLLSRWVDGDGTPSLESSDNVGGIFSSCLRVSASRREVHLQSFHAARDAMGTCRGELPGTWSGVARRGAETRRFWVPHGPRCHRSGGSALFWNVSMNHRLFRPFRAWIGCGRANPGALPRAGVCRAVGAPGSWQASQALGRLVGRWVDGDGTPSLESSDNVGEMFSSWLRVSASRREVHLQSFHAVSDVMGTCRGELSGASAVTIQLPLSLGLHGKRRR